MWFTGGLSSAYVFGPLLFVLCEEKVLSSKADVFDFALVSISYFVPDVPLSAFSIKKRWQQLRDSYGVINLDMGS